MCETRLAVSGQLGADKLQELQGLRGTAPLAIHLGDGAAYGGPISFEDLLHVIALLFLGQGPSSVVKFYW